MFWIEPVGTGQTPSSHKSSSVPELLNKQEDKANTATMNRLDDFDGEMVGLVLGGGDYLIR